MLDAHAAGLAREGVTSWACYPKANKTDINRDTLWPIFMEYRLRPNGVRRSTTCGRRCATGR